jgi:hypothetical protein
MSAGAWGSHGPQAVQTRNLTTGFDPAADVLVGPLGYLG